MLLLWKEELSKSTVGRRVNTAWYSVQLEEYAIALVIPAVSCALIYLDERGGIECLRHAGTLGLTLSLALPQLTSSPAQLFIYNSYKPPQIRIRITVAVTSYSPLLA